MINKIYNSVWYFVKDNYIDIKYNINVTIQDKTLLISGFSTNTSKKFKNNLKKHLEKTFKRGIINIVLLKYSEKILIEEYKENKIKNKYNIQLYKQNGIIRLEGFTKNYSINNIVYKIIMFIEDTLNNLDKSFKLTSYDLSLTIFNKSITNLRFYHKLEDNDYGISLIIQEEVENILKTSFDTLLYYNV